ncbi:MAG TPA: M14 family metallopeptidase [Bacillales bacterium]|nr:M14 family metallopeptidase [Bacillales bacterium]
MRITIRRGDTLWYVSQLFNVPLQLLIDSNPNVNPQSLAVGKEIDVPGYITESYTIKSGDTFWEIATRRRLSLETLLRANPRMDPLRLRVGETIRIPVRVTDLVVNWRTQYDYETLTRDINRLVDIYPFLRRNRAGNSVMGKEIAELRIGNGPKNVHFDGSFHANEWTTTPMLMRFVNEYLIALTNRGTIRGLYMAPFYSETSLSVVPMVNPDGVNLVIHGLPDQEPYRSQVLRINNGSTDFSGWKANINGVDLNDQFPARWYIEARRREQQPSPANYPGTAPLTEPEAQAIARLTRERNYNRVLAFHTQGEVIYWGFLGYEPPESRVLVNEFSRVSGYRAVRYVDSYAGYKDWFIQEWRRPGFTVEMGTGPKPIPLGQFAEIYQENLGIFLASLYM